MHLPNRATASPMRWLVLAVAIVVAQGSVVGVAVAQHTGSDTVPSRGSATDSAGHAREPQKLEAVRVRARYQKRPSVFSYFEGEPSSRTESVGPAGTEWLDPFAVGNGAALLRATPDMLVSGDGSVSALGVPGSSNQVSIGGVRVPADLVTGMMGGSVTTSPWDVTIGGAAGATLDLFSAPAQGRYHNSYLAVRSGIGGVPPWNDSRGGAAGLNIPTTLNGAISGPAGKFTYSLQAFLSRDETNLPRWDNAIDSQQRGILDSVSRVLGSSIVAGTQSDVKGGIIGRLDLVPNSDKRALTLTSALTHTSATSGSGSGYLTGSLGTSVVEDIGLLQLESTQILKERVLLKSLLSTSLTSSDVKRAAVAPTVVATDVVDGNTFVTGGSPPQPTSNVFDLEGRSTGTWYSRDNATRYVMQLQARLESARVGARGPHSTFVAASSNALQNGEAISLVRDGGAPAAMARSFVVAPAIGARHDVGKNASVLLGVRADAWTMSGIAAPGPLRYVDVSPRVSFLERLGKRSGNRGAIATLRMGAGRFTDWPSVRQWTDAWRGAPQSIQSCTGLQVPAIELGVEAPRCLSGGTVQTIERTSALNDLRPTASNRADVSLSFAEVAPNMRGEIGAALAQTDRITTQLSPLMNASVADRLSGEDGRALLVPERGISEDGVVPVAAVPGGIPDVTRLASDGRSVAEQWRVAIGTKDPFARVIWRATYVLTTGYERSLAIASPNAAPTFVTGPLAAGGRHTFAFSVSQWIGAATLRFSGIARSGVRFTPLADRDLNGDGIANDAAYIPAAQSAAWASMESPGVRQCIRDAAGRIAGVNSCTGPWSISSLFQASVPGAKFGLPRGSELSVQLSNPLELLGRVNGVVFGSVAPVDPFLLHITGFDSVTHRFSGQPLRAFGAPVGLSAEAVDPVRLAVSIRLPLGPSVTSQRADETLRAMRANKSGAPSAETATDVVGDIPPIPYVIARSGEGIQLTAAQRASLAALGSRWQSSAARIVMDAYADSGRADDPHLAHARLVRSRAQFMVEAEAITAQVRAVLSPDQIDLLPDSVKQLLNPRFWNYIALFDAGTI